MTTSLEEQLQREADQWSKAHPPQSPSTSTSDQLYYGKTAAELFQLSDKESHGKPSK